MEKISNIRLSVHEDESLLIKKIAKIARVKEEKIAYFAITKKSIDARKKDDVHFVYSVEFDTKPKAIEKVDYPQITTDKRVVVVGLGPAGLFAGLTLARHGLKPLILERGESVTEREKIVDNFLSGGEFNSKTNVQFGEGGAGTFSDGKLNTQVNNRLIDQVLKDFTAFGAPREIVYLSKPHIGSDKLISVVKSLREEILRLGGQVMFNTQVTDLVINGGKLCAVKANAEEIPCDYLVLAIGHSARDTFEMLYSHNVDMEQKEFAVGVRTEQLQEVINRSQFGSYAKYPKLGSADYKLVYHGADRSAFTFCMCPGGVVIPATSEENSVVVNGMSNYLRNERNANSALVAQIKRSDFASSHPLSGVDFQRELERKAFVLGGGGYKAPVQLAEDFISDRISSGLKGVVPSYHRGYEMANLNELFPKGVSDTLKGALVQMENKLKGFSSQGAVLTGVESRTSSPIRIVRGNDLQSTNIKGLFPCGEGCGYAGGIMSASIDGIRVANAVISAIQGL